MASTTHDQHATIDVRRTEDPSARRKGGKLVRDEVLSSGSDETVRAVRAVLRTFARQVRPRK